MEKIRIILTEQSIPKFPKGVRLKHDTKRNQWVILAPERMFVLDDIGISVMQCIEEELTISNVVNRLTDRFNAPRKEILKDVLEMLQDMADKGVLTA